MSYAALTELFDEGRSTLPVPDDADLDALAAALLATGIAVATALEPDVSVGAPGRQGSRSAVS